MTILSSDLSFSSMSASDFGRIFWWDGRLFRGIPPDYVNDVQMLFDSGLIPSLIAKKLFIKSWISPLNFEGFALVIEHEVITVPLYPKEWTFSMLRDAASLILDLNECAMKFGYQTSDCHGYNVLFQENHPVYVDLGSFTKMKKNDGVLYAYHEFMRSYYYPIKIWSTGGEYLALKSVPRIGSFIPSEAYLKYRWPIFRFFKDPLLAKAVRFLHLIRTVQHRDMDSLINICPKSLTWFLSWLVEHNIFSRPAKINRLKTLINKIKLSRSESVWSNYHDGFAEDGRVISDPRFDFVAEKVASLNVQSVLEIAGNQGALSRILASNTNIKSIICTDADGSALDKGYCSTRTTPSNIIWAILNPFSYENARVEIPLENRFKSEVVIALALTHHLILTQNFRLEFIFDVLTVFSKKYVFVEFMPLGLYNGKKAVSVPDWYNVDWFERGFNKKFELIEKSQLEKNRILFIGKIREASN